VFNLEMQAHAHLEQIQHLKSALLSAETRTDHLCEQHTRAIEQVAATHCNKVQHTVTHCNKLRHTATHCDALRHTAAHCSTLQHTATHDNTRQHAATHGNTLQPSTEQHAGAMEQMRIKKRIHRRRTKETYERDVLKRHMKEMYKRTHKTEKIPVKRTCEEVLYNRAS